ncbi:hypothetical protein ALQ65_200090 [Pseudomonas syringae pv. coriandricola]|uniref:Uncharacterized protein n=1 Tax=Pseudomonas syringae pv. coriandricola TaxID=264453 RepID=A0A3M3JDN6_9PSED|nr:hypothetical protein ALQ65_200090 [Pseudomonas syringae pv. coriandricola]
MAVYLSCEGSIVISSQNGSATCSGNSFNTYLPSTSEPLFDIKDAQAIVQGCLYGSALILVFWLIKKAIDI